MFFRKWVFPNLAEEKLIEFSREWKVSQVVAMLLYSRGFRTKEDVNSFLNNKFEIQDPFLFTDMYKFVKRINKAIENFEKICIYGDYDTDGIVATVLMYTYLNDRGANVVYIVPSRGLEGYGLSEKVLKKMKEMDIELIITVDNGISANREIELASELGMETIVIDHHIPNEIPNACAVIDPHRDLNVNFKDYAAVGVVFKTLEALEFGRISWNDLMEKYGDLVALGTIGDVVPLLNENRKIVAEGIKVIERTNRPGTRALLKESDNITYVDLDSLFISFNIVPKINSCGRIGDPELAVKLFFSENNEEANSINEILKNKNKIRKKMCDHLFDEIKCIINNDPKIGFQPIIIVQGENWNHGILGVAASRVVSKYCKPVILFSIKGNEVIGSARSIVGFSVFDAIAECKEYLERFGGHKMAAGLNLKRENLEEFKEKILKYSVENYVPDVCLNIDCILDTDYLNVKTVDEMNILKPFGSENVEPIFVIVKAKLLNFYTVSNGKHLKLFFSKKDKNFYAMYFGMELSGFFYEKGDILDLVVCLKNNFYSKEKNLTISIRDIKYSCIDINEMVRQRKIFENFMIEIPQDRNDLLELLPFRDEIVLLYKMLKKNSLIKTSIDVLFKKISEFDINLAKLYIIIELLKEFDLIDIENNFNDYKIFVKNINKKIDLNSSKLLINIKKKLDNNF